MSCEGCIYGMGKEAGCDFSYACNNGGRPVTKRESKEDKKTKKIKKKEDT